MRYFTASHGPRMREIAWLVSGALALTGCTVVGPDFEKPDVLEIGCGTGALTQHLLEIYKGGRFHITDISPQMVALARERIGAVDGIDWSVMDGEDPLGNRQYDLIVGNMVFHWFENAEEALVKLRRLLKPGGVLFYTVPAPTCFKEWQSVLSELSLPMGLLNFKTLPGVLREEERVVEHKSTLHFLQSLKQIGAHTSQKGYTKLGYADLLKACRMADEKFQGQMTWHILYGCLQG